MPGRCAAPPAPAMITWMPRDSAFDANAASHCGVRCADTTWFSCSTPKRASTSLAFFIVSQSDVLPMMTATSGLLIKKAPSLLRFQIQPIRDQVQLRFAQIRPQRQAPRHEDPKADRFEKTLARLRRRGAHVHSPNAVLAHVIEKCVGQPMPHAAAALSVVDVDVKVRWKTRPQIPWLILLAAQKTPKSVQEEFPRAPAFPGAAREKTGDDPLKRHLPAQDRELDRIERADQVADH